MENLSASKNPPSHVLIKLPQDDLVIACGEAQFQNMTYVLKELLRKKNYAKLQVKDREVVDIGAFCGETAVYFAKKGAAKVHAFEPLFSYHFINLNAELNHVEDQIIPYHMAVLSHKNGLHIVENSHVNGSTTLASQETSTGLFIKSMTLQDVVKKLSKREVVLKIDCEGGEYDIILNTDLQTLQRFSEMIIECHFEHGDYLEIVKRLEEANFVVEILELMQERCLLYACQKEHSGHSEVVP